MTPRKPVPGTNPPQPQPRPKAARPGNATHAGVRRPMAETMRPQPSPATITQPPVKARSRGKLILALTAVFLLLLGGGAAAWWALSGPPRSDPAPAKKELDPSLVKLKELQQKWWDTEGLASGSSDPEGAFQRLLEQQRDWWDKESLNREGDPDGTTTIPRLEKMQRSWWESQGLAGGQASKDPDALSKLDEISHRWWEQEGVARSTNTEQPGDTAGGPGTAPLDSDKQIKLLDRDSTRRFLASGGTEESEQAVFLGLKWLAAQQENDGSWEPNGKAGGRVLRNKKGAVQANSVVSTAFALLPFVAHGETHKGTSDHNTYSKPVERGLKFLMDRQKADGDMRSGGNMYIHALATIALCEAHVASADPLLRPSCEKAVQFLIKAQDSRGGGWRYTPGQAGDMSVTSWCLMGLKSAHMAGIGIPTNTLVKANQFLKQQSRADGGYNYLGNSPGHSPPTPAVMTAAGLVCRQFLLSEESPSSPNMSRGAPILLNHLPNAHNRNFYYYYYATYALLPIGGEAWKTWNPKVRDLIVGWQDQGTQDPALKGSWDPRGAHQLERAGRVGVTALALLTLEVYYRHLSVTRPELGEMVKDLNSKTPGKK